MQADARDVDIHDHEDQVLGFNVFDLQKIGEADFHSIIAERKQYIVGVGRFHAMMQAHHMVFVACFVHLHDYDVIVMDFLGFGTPPVGLRSSTGYSHPLNLNRP